MLRNRKPPSDDPKVNANRARARDWHQLLREVGLCGRCGQVESPDRFACAPCREKERERARRKAYEALA